MLRIIRFQGQKIELFKSLSMPDYKGAIKI